MLAATTLVYRQGVIAAIGIGEVLLVVLVLVLIFGARKLPDLARALRKSGKEFKEGLHGDDEES